MYQIRQNPTCSPFYLQILTQILKMEMLPAFSHEMGGSFTPEGSQLPLL